MQAKSLIDLCNEIEKSPTIIKCDIEGGKYIIYKQLVKCAKLFKLRKIFVQCHASKYPQYKDLHEDPRGGVAQNCAFGAGIPT